MRPGLAYVFRLTLRACAPLWPRATALGAGLTYFAASPVTTGCPAPAQAAKPPRSAVTFFLPACSSMSAARALVASSRQLQYVTMGVVEFFHSAARAVTVSSGTETAPGMWPAR